MREGDEIYAVLRYCRRCLAWLPVDDFHGLLCDGCVRSYDQRRVGAIQLNRGIALTEKGRAFVAAERAA